MSNYPSRIDTDAELPGVIDNVTEVTAEIINSIREALIAVETAIGVDPQGSTASLTDRINQALNADGTIRSSALSSAGLVTLPITNTQVGASAAIEETKLDLDVGTQSLQDQVTSNDIDIAELQNRLQAQINRFIRHVTGIGDRHNSTHIDHTLMDGYALGAGSTVQTALDFTFGTIEQHKKATTDIQHFAQAIRYIPTSSTPGIPAVITATNVQDAITEIDDGIKEQLRIHSDDAHSDGVSNDGYLSLGGQASVNDASLQLTRYAPTSGKQISKIGLCNSAVVKTKGFNPNNIGSLAESIDIEVEIGSATRTLSITGLDGAAYPAGVGRVSLLGVVAYLNAAFADTGTAAHFPVAAFASDDGELVLQHNLARDDCTITVRDPGLNSAIDALGFTDIEGTKVRRVDNYSFLVNGTRFTELKTLLDGYSTQSLLSATVDLGTNVESAGVRENMLLHVHSHTATAANGTYRIDGYSGNQVVLNETLAVGGFSYTIYEDTMDVNDLRTDRRHALDFYLDDNRDPVTSDRCVIQFGGVQGVRIVEVSQDFEAMIGTFTLATDGTDRQMFFTDGDGYSGVSSVFTPGFIGYTKVWAPDNVGFATVLVFDITPVIGVDIVTIIGTENQDDRLLLGTNHYNGLTSQEIPVRRTNIGLVGETSVGSEFRRETIASDIDAFHFAGVIRGFDIVTSTTDELRVRGGTAYIGGKKVQRNSETIQALNYASTDGTWNLVLTRDGNLEIYEELAGSSTGFPVSEILASENLILIAQFTVSSSAITAVQDARFLVNDIETRLQLTVDDRDLGAGSFQSLEAAVLYSKNAPNDTKPEITILSDLTFDTAQTIDSGSRIISFGDLTFNSTLTLSSNSELIVFGSIDANAAVTIESGGILACFGTSDFSSTITMNSDSTIRFGNSAAVGQIIVAGNRVNIVGREAREPRVQMTFPGSASGIDITTGFSNIIIRDIDFIMTTSTNACVFSNGSNDNIVVDRCTFRQSTTLSTTQLAQTARAGIQVDGFNDKMTVTDGYFFNLGSGINVADTVNSMTVTRSLFKDIGTCCELDDGDNLLWTLSRHENIHNVGLQISGGASDGIISDNVWRDNFDVTSTPVVFTLTNINNYVIEGNLISGFSNTTSLISSPGSSNGITFANNIIQGCTTTSFAISALTNEEGVFSGNVIREHDGGLIRFSAATHGSVCGNVFEATSGLSGTSVNIFGTETMNVAGNTFVAPTTDTMELSGVTFTGNRAELGRVIVLQADTASSAIGDNVFTLGDTSATYSISIDNTTSSPTTVSGNVIFGAAGIGADSSVVYMDNGHIIFDSNYVESTGSAIRAITADDPASTQQKVISNNLVSSGATYGIFVNSNAVSVTGNFVYGAVGVGGGDIVVGTGNSNVIVTSNFANGSGGSERVFHQDSAPTNSYIGLNKNALERRTFSVYTAMLDNGTWTVTNNGISSSTSGDVMFVPLNNLPVGVELESVNVNVSNAGGAGDAVLEVFRRSSTSLTGVSISASTSAPAGAFNSVNVPITSTEYIDDSEEFYVEVTLTANTAITIGQTIANIRV